MQVKVGIIGCGNMGEAIIKGILAKKIITKKNIFISDKITDKAEKLKDKYGINVLVSNAGLIKKIDALIIAVKPQDADGLLEEMKSGLTKNKLLISIMAGVTIEKMKIIINRDIPIVRVMPNMAAIVGESISAISYNSIVKDGHKKIVEKLFKGIGEITEIKEEFMDTFTALCGSGPAYFYYFTECLIDAAVKQGFSNEDALKLVAQTLCGSAKALIKSKEDPKALRQKVTSRGGTTEAALKVFEEKNIKQIVLDAVLAAAKRSKELSQ